MFPHSNSRIKNSFVIKAADVDNEKALKIAEILFGEEYTDIQIESIENDNNTLTPSEYGFIRRILEERRQSDLRCAEHRIINGIEKGPYIETEFDKYVLGLIHKMKARMEQFPVYHT